jgi:GTPase Era involved in 16S rRNA processing
LDAYGFEGHEQLTLNTMLPSVDFCLFITTCKTNSDGKTKSVLNTIAQYDKPVIIIQNMIDSVKPSLNNDGTIRKTEAEVADEHRMRVIKIVDESKIQSKVVILQYSAVWARDGQIRHDKDLLQKSGYNDLVSVIKETFRQLKPKTENKRLVFLKQELEKMISEARKDGAGSLVPMGIFEYEALFQT